MNAQNIVVALILLSALIYVGSLLRKKVKAFQPKANDCGADCGCSAKSSKS